MKSQRHIGLSMKYLGIKGVNELRIMIIGACAIVAVFAASALAWFATYTDTVTARYPNGQLQEYYQEVRYEEKEARPQKTGFYRSWHANGALEWDGQYNRDSKIGTWVHWDTAGNRIEETSYQAGVKQGMEIVWNPNRTKGAAVNYRNGKIHGLATWYKEGYDVTGEFNNPDLAIVAMGFYLDGALVLPIRDSTDELGIGGLVDSLYYNADLDLWVEGRPYGRFFYIGHKIDGQKHGVWIRWNVYGDAEEINVFDHGKLLEF